MPQKHRGTKKILGTYPVPTPYLRWVPTGIRSIPAGTLKFSRYRGYLECT